MKNKIIVILMALTFLFASATQAADNMKKTETPGDAAVANYKSPEINPVEVAGLGLQLFFVDLWKFNVDNSKGNNAY